MFEYLAIFCIAFVGYPFQQAQDDLDYKVQGEYQGKVEARGQELKLGLQVIALGEGKFSAKVFRNGLPGDKDFRPSSRAIGESALKDGVLRFENPNGDEAIEIKDGVAKLLEGENQIGELKRTVRKSPTLGMKPPENAVVLFGNGGDSSKMKEKYGNLWGFKGKAARISDEGLLMEGAVSTKKFQSHRVHIEFLLPFQPKERGQKRGNSGIYLQGRYEVQMLDSFGLEGEDNECGGIYKTSRPKLNMCYPPMQWQTYDIEFHAAEFKGDEVAKNAWMTVKHNGVVIHDKVELPKATAAASKTVGSEPGPVYLQNHGNPVRYRNIWVVPISDDSE